VDQVIIWAVVGGALALLTASPARAIGIGVACAVAGTVVHLGIPPGLIPGGWGGLLIAGEALAALGIVGLWWLQSGGYW